MSLLTATQEIVRQSDEDRSYKTLPLYKGYFFGPFHVLKGDEPLGEPAWRRNKAKSLLKWFLLNPGQLYSSHQLAKLFWPDASKVAAARNLHVTIHYLRHLLEPDLPSPQHSRYIRRRKNNLYWFERDETWWTDHSAIDQFYNTAMEAEQRNDYPCAIAYYCKVIKYCSQGFLSEDAYEDAFSMYRRQYDRLYTEILQRLIYIHTQLEMFDEVLFYSHQARSQEPYSELVIKAIVNAHIQQGNMASAIRTLDDFQCFLRRDLGIEPGEDILALKQAWYSPIP